MSHFHHPHITQLIGVCSKDQVLIVMELAELGEVRIMLFLNTSKTRKHVRTTVLRSGNDNRVIESIVILQMRSFLQENRHVLGIPTLMTYCYQLSAALAYLESKHFVHRSAIECFVKIILTSPQNGFVDSET